MGQDDLSKAKILYCKAVFGNGISCVTEMNFCMNHAKDPGSIPRPVDLWSSALPLVIIESISAPDIWHQMITSQKIT